jgi:hypothetical protein
MGFKSFPRLAFSLFPLLFGLLSCGRNKDSASEDHEDHASYRQTLHLSPLALLRDNGDVSSLTCLLVLVHYVGNLAPESGMNCSLSDASSLVVDEEKAVDLSGGSPVTVQLVLKKLPLRFTIFAMDASALAASGELCSNQSITALPALPLYRVYRSSEDFSPTATSTVLVIPRTQVLSTLATLRECH